MKLIITANELETEFKRLTRQYEKYYWATAWAGVSSTLFNELIAKKDRIEKIIVGIHFYQTHPDFIETFRENSKVKFIKQPEGTFHPKLYLFYDSNTKWELLIGSANFTNEAFSRNTEATTLISSKDSNAEDILETAFSLIQKSWSEANKFTKTELDNYRIAWKNHRPKINSLSGQYGSPKKTSKPMHEVPVANMTWKEFISKVKNDTHGIKNRLAVVTKSKELFESKKHFNQLENDERKFIAGLRNQLPVEKNVDWGLFGSMKGAAIFATKIIAKDTNISKALDQIPLQGQITKTHYDNFIKHYRKTFSGSYIATATRLLAMKRPDTFVCIDSKNRAKLCKHFGIQQSEMTYERYWTDIIERIFDSEWWLNPEPKNEQEERVSETRAAFLDALYYEA